LLLALRADAPVDLLGQARVDRIDEVSDVILDVGNFNILTPEVTRIDHFKQIADNLDDRAFVGQRRRGQVFELWLETPKCLKHFASDFPNLIPLPQMLMHIEFPLPLGEGGADSLKLSRRVRVASLVKS